MRVCRIVVAASGLLLLLLMSFATGMRIAHNLSSAQPNLHISVESARALCLSGRLFWLLPEGQLIQLFNNNHQIITCDD